MDLYFDLQRFAEGGAEAAADTAQATETAADAATVQQEQQTADAAAQANATPTFDDLLNGNAAFKQEFEKRVKRAAYNARRTADKERRELYPMYEALGRRYGLDVSDVNKMDLKALNTAVMADDALLEEEAAAQGMTVEGLRTVKSAQRRLAAIEAERAEEQLQNAWQATVAEAEQLKSVYPGFDLETELNNEQFSKLLAALQHTGFTNAVRTAYESVHGGEIMGGAMQYAVQRTRQQISESIRSGKSRPAEAGSAAHAQTNTDPKHMSAAQIEEIRQRVMRGEKVDFTG